MAYEPPRRRTQFTEDEITQIISALRRKFTGGGRWLGRLLTLAVVLIILATSYYQVEPEEVGMVTRFGKYVRMTNPGPHVKLPLGMERVQKVPVERQLK